MVPSRVKERRAIRDKNLLLAAAEVRAGKCTLREASEKYSIPKSTLWDRLSGKVPFGATSGPERYLNDTEEEQLVKFLVGAAKIGFPRSKKQVITIVQASLAKKRGCSVDDIHVTSGWWTSFKKRHPMLTLRSGSKLSYRRLLASSPETINAYFDTLEEAMQKNKLQNSPMLIYNCDETGFPLEHKPCKVIGVCGQRDLPSITSGDKTQITVLAACSASGNLIPPMIIFDRKRLKPTTHMIGEVPGTVYASSKKGWIDSEIFLDWFVNCFLLNIPPQRPVLLLVDGHSSHYHPDVIRKATENHIILFCLPPHTTHLCQPLDRSCYSPLKAAYNQQCQQFLCTNPGQVINRFNFTSIFAKAWAQAMTPSNIIMGFRATGVYPLNRYIVLQHVTNSDDNCEIDELASKMGMYVPLYSPSKYQHQQLIDESLDTSISDDDSMTGSDIEPADSLQNMQPSFVSEFLVLPEPPKSKNIYTAKVLTSSEHLRLIEEKEREKARKEEEKEFRKQERERKRDEKKRQLELKPKRKARNKSVSQPEPLFSNEEHKRFSTRQENGYNIPDDRYCQWLRIFYPNDPLVSLNLPITSINTYDNESSSDTDIGDHSKGKNQNVQLSRGSKEIGTYRGTLAQSTEDGGGSRRIGTRGTLTQSSEDGGGSKRIGTRGTLTQSSEDGGGSKRIGTRGALTQSSEDGGGSKRIGTRGTLTQSSEDGGGSKRIGTRGTLTQSSEDGGGSKRIGTRGTLAHSTEDGGGSKRIGTRGTLTQSSEDGGGSKRIGTRGTLTRSTEDGRGSKRIGTTRVRSYSSMSNRKGSKGVILDSSDVENSESIVSKDAYCVCKSGEFGEMIYCDAKECKIGWWHFHCAGIEKAPVGKWFCRLCRSSDIM
ncbi:PREDICTED: uncharacterized protein LOC100641974 isoform X2 [Amphimedon queenslandica]|uniref:PHD-type domain-containing protein n=1 Tax=Amphimedon queenslandica TaxID=400682 RepID=A0AAN0JBX6_AMPQE|nr:PREDICTED: uncharacterized protein LOC100641974 isoform X2 [Amphimedon queenslandica]|eukprot:XP_019854203.1 PREDICTED: uncharacterized protein LOC100641974 isoform X2 [Amphimedon queenslandica]